MNPPLIINVADAPASGRPRRVTQLRFEPDDLLPQPGGSERFVLGAK